MSNLKLNPLIVAVQNNDSEQVKALLNENVSYLFCFKNDLEITRIFMIFLDSGGR